MKKTVLFIGGVQGVGKSTVIDKIRQSDPSWAFYDPGLIFEDYYLKERVIDPKVLETMAAIGFEGLFQEKTLVNWHYGVWNKGEYIPHIDWSKLKFVAKKLQNTNVVFVLLCATKESVWQRRKKDQESGVKSRILDLETIQFELETENFFFERHLEIFQGDNVSSMRLENISSQQSANTLIAST